MSIDILGYLNLAVFNVPSSPLAIVGLVVSVMVVAYALQVWYDATYGVPGPTPWPILGNIPEMLPYLRRGKLHEYFDMLRAKYGPIHRIVFPGKTHVVVSEAAAVRRLLTNNAEFRRSPNIKYISSGIMEYALFVLPSDDAWKRHRKLLQPAFGPSHLRLTVTAASKVAHEVAESLRARIAASSSPSPNGAHDGANPAVVVDAYMYFTAIALEVIGMVAFSHSFESIRTLDADQSNEGMTMVQDIFKIVEARFFLPRPLWWVLGVQDGSRRVKSVRSSIESILKLLITERRAQKSNVKSDDSKGRWGVDVLDRLIDHEGDGNGGFSDDEIMGEVVGFFIAGHETTSNTMTLMMLELCQNPDVMRRLVDEIDEVYERIEGKITTENLHEFRYLEWVMKETQRHLSIARALSRINIVPVEIMGYTIPANTTLQASIANVHLDPAYWNDPETFNPERWSEPIVPGSFLPFGDGQHVCIGQKMATVEMRVVFIHLLRQFKFELEPNQTVEFITLGTFGLKRGLRVCVTERVHT